MNVTRFQEHWGLSENPFRAEEARHDPVFGRLGVGPTTHPEFEKILGDLTRPSAAIVFGEKGSGKTAIRLQIEQRVEEHNVAHPERRVLMVAYDDLNPVIDAVCTRRGVGQDSKPAAIEEALEGFRLTDHMDAVLQQAVRLLVDHVLGRHGGGVARRLRVAPIEVKSDMIALHLAYDRDTPSGRRTKELRRAIGVRGSMRRLGWFTAAWLGWALPVGALVLWGRAGEAWLGGKAWLTLTAVMLGIWLIPVLWVTALEPFLRVRRARKLARKLGGAPRRVDDLAASLGRVPTEMRNGGALALDHGEESRYAMFERLRHVLRATGFAGTIVVMDRVDEPILVQGDPVRMRSVVWPLLNNKCLQMDGLGLKMLLPIELRHELFRETSAFFQEARMDKQSLVERLSWTGAMLYDLCNGRLAACRADGGEAVALVDLFEAEVTRKDVVEALDQMHQPRDAFKFLYSCMQEHCSNVTEEEASWRIPRLTLESVKKQQVERVQMLYRGVRPG